jgi:lysophospholipase L1-like esterase
MKVLVVTDSLGLPRPAPQTVTPEQTWVSLLAKSCDLAQFSSGGATIGDLHAQVEYMKMHRPDLVIIQSGIVDCAPRAFSRFENEFINKFRLTRSLSRRILNKERIVKLRARRNVTYTPLADFASFADKFSKAFSDVYWVEIAPSNADYERRVPGITRNIELYNDVLRKVSAGKTISLSDFSTEDIMPDHIHLSVSGNRKLAEKALAILRQYEKTA